jgi:thiol:disulfide interchange protein
MSELSGFFGIIILALDIYAIIKIFGSNASTTAKVLWTLLIVILPILGLLIWLLAGPSSGKRGAPV